MSSTLIVTAGASAAMTSAGTAALLGPLGLGIVLGVAAISFFTGSNSKRADNIHSSIDMNLTLQQQEDRRMERELQRQQMISDSWVHFRIELQNQASEIKSVYDREVIKNSVDTLEDSYLSAMNNGDSLTANNLIEGMRRKILSVKMEEHVLESRQDGMIKFVEELKGKVPEGFMYELADIRRDILASWSSLKELSERIDTLGEKLRIIVGDVRQINALSLGELEEEIVFIPHFVKPLEDDSNANFIALLVKDICDFGERIAFFDEDEADRLKPLITESKSESSSLRLRAIRDQIKTTYGRLKERAVLTEMFRRDLRDFLSPMKKALGTDALCIQIESLMTAPYITRDEFNRVYRAVKEVFSSQIESIVDKLFAEKVGSELKSIGYSLIDEEGSPVEIPSGKVCTVSTPYEGYQIRLKVGRDKSIVTRLVRVVESEEEKSHVSEYQKQKDTEIGKKLCEDLKGFYESLENEGITIHELMRKEPGQEALDMIVLKSSSTKKSTASSARTQEQKVNARRM